MPSLQQVACQLLYNPNSPVMVVTCSILGQAVSGRSTRIEHPGVERPEEPTQTLLLSVTNKKTGGPIKTLRLSCNVDQVQGWTKLHDPVSPDSKSSSKTRPGTPSALAGRFGPRVELTCSMSTPVLMVELPQWCKAMTWLSLWATTGEPEDPPWVSARYPMSGPGRVPHPP